MAKKARPAKQQTADTCASRHLVDAIATVRRLQAFIAEQGGLEKASGTVDGVRQLMELTGGFAQLKEAMGIVGKETAAPQE